MHNNSQMLRSLSHLLATNETAHLHNNSQTIRPLSHLLATNTAEILHNNSQTIRSLSHQLCTTTRKPMHVRDNSLSGTPAQQLANRYTCTANRKSSARNQYICTLSHQLVTNTSAHFHINSQPIHPRSTRVASATRRPAFTSAARPAPLSTRLSLQSAVEAVNQSTLSNRSVQSLRSLTLSGQHVPINKYQPLRSLTLSGQHRCNL